MKTRQMSDRQMTGKNNGAAVSGVNGRVVDFRKDPAPTNWLVKQALEDAKDDGYPVENFKAPSDYLKEFIGELSELRCEPVCANGQLADGCNRPAVGCICSLVEQLTNPDVDLVVPKDAFLAIVGAAGYGTEAMAQRRRWSNTATISAKNCGTKMGQKSCSWMKNAKTPTTGGRNWIAARHTHSFWQLEMNWMR